MTSSPRQLHGKLGHSHLHWGHNVYVAKTQWAPFYHPHYHWSQPLFLKTRFVTSSSYLLHHPQVTLKAIGFAGNVRNRFSSDQCKDILPVCGRLSMKKTTPSLILLSLLRKKISFLCPHPWSFTPSPSSNSSNPP